MLSYRKLLDDATKTLYDIGDTPRIDAEYLMQHAIDKSMAWLISHGDTPASTTHTKAFFDLVAKRAAGTPVAYILGYREFWTLRLHVDNSVLIPRGDTEILVEQALERLSPKTHQAVLDLGTGSGAIALSIAKELPLSAIMALDKHAAALKTAKLNATENNIGNVVFRQSDWFSSLGGEKFDLIASNPPYIDAEDPHLVQGDLRFEPDTALIAENNGLSDLNHIIDQAPDYLHRTGWLLLEHGFQQAEDVSALLIKRGFDNITLYADLNHLPRCTAAQWN